MIVASSPEAGAALQACCPSQCNWRQLGRAGNQAARMNLHWYHNSPRSKGTPTCWSRPVATQSGESTADTRPGCPIRSRRCTCFLGSRSTCQQSTTCLCHTPHTGWRPSGPRNGPQCQRGMVWAPNCPDHTTKRRGTAVDAGCEDSDSRSPPRTLPRSVSSLGTWGQPSQPAPVRSHTGNPRQVPGGGPGQHYQ